MLTHASPLSADGAVEVLTGTEVELATVFVHLEDDDEKDDAAAAPTSAQSPAAPVLHPQPQSSGSDDELVLSGSSAEEGDEDEEEEEDDDLYLPSLGGASGVEMSADREVAAARELEKAMATNDKGESPADQLENYYKLVRNNTAMTCTWVGMRKGRGRELMAAAVVCVLLGSVRRCRPPTV